MCLIEMQFVFFVLFSPWFYYIQVARSKKITRDCDVMGRTYIKFSNIWKMLNYCTKRKWDFGDRKRLGNP
jgi:hypothetical protein